MVDRRSSYVSKTMVRCSTDVSSIGGHQTRIPNEVRESRTVMSVRAPWTRGCYLHVYASVVVVVTAKRKMDGFVCQRLVQGE